MLDYDPVQVIGNAALSLPDAMRAIEKDFIIVALDATEGDCQKAADLLGVNRTTLIMKRKTLRVDGERDRPAYERLILEQARLRARLRFLDYFLKK